MEPDPDLAISETRAAAHACFEEGVMVEGFMLISTAIDQHGERRWAIRSDPDQGAFVTMGLAALARAYLEEHIDAHLGYHHEE